MEQNKIINIYILPKIQNMLDYITNEFPIEMKGYYTGKILSSGDILIDGLLIPYQEAKGAEVDVSAKQLIKLRKEYKKRCERIIGDFHSHNTLGCCWSPADRKQQQEYSATRDFTIFTVGSKGKYITKLIIRKPFNLEVDHINLQTYVDKKTLADIKRELNKKVKNVEPPVVKVQCHPHYLQKNITLNDICASETIKNRVVINKLDVECKHLTDHEYELVLDLCDRKNIHFDAYDVNDDDNNLILFTNSEFMSQQMAEEIINILNTYENINDELQEIYDTEQIYEVYKK